MTFDLLAVLQIGGPVFALAVVQLFYSNRRASRLEDHVKDLTLMATNHLAHIEPGLNAINESINHLGDTLERLVTRIDWLNDKH